MRSGLLSVIIIAAVICTMMPMIAVCAESVGIWMRFEKGFVSDRAYDNPLYDVGSFTVSFTSPSGRMKNVQGFWDGGTDWKVRFCPDETGTWTYGTACSDEKNRGLNGVSGTFDCVPNRSDLDIYTKGCVVRPKGSYHLAHADGTPFFWLGDTAWNGPLKSTEEEWETYLDDRTDKGYSVIQFVTTQWRGGDKNSLGQVAFEGSGKIALNVDFFRHLDGKIDKINDHGLVAAPVLLWALHYVRGRELSPGYHLPQEEAILLAKYMVARYGAHHVVWVLGGDGKFVDEYEERWKVIGRGVFGGGHPGLVTLHPMGRSWYGGVYDDEDWLDIISYQSSHSTSKGTVEFITRGPAANEWDRLPPRPIINLEPIYDNINPNVTARDVRNACWWSVFASPVAGITYGANGIWSWLREGEEILNHRNFPGIKRWHESIRFPSDTQTAWLAAFIRQFDWWKLRPAQELLAAQPGDEDYRRFISVMATGDRVIILAYIPVRSTVELFNPRGLRYSGRWFNPETNEYTDAEVLERNGKLSAVSPGDTDFVLILEKH